MVQAQAWQRAAARAGGKLLDGMLRKIEGFLSRHASGTIAWIIGILGILLAVNAYGQLQNVSEMF